MKTLHGPKMTWANSGCPRPNLFHLRIVWGRNAIQIGRNLCAQILNFSRARKTGRMDTVEMWSVDREVEQTTSSICMASWFSWICRRKIMRWKKKLGSMNHESISESRITCINYITSTLRMDHVSATKCVFSACETLSESRGLFHRHPETSLVHWSTTFQQKQLATSTAKTTPFKPSNTDANEGLQDVLWHDVGVACLSNVFTVHIPGRNSKQDELHPLCWKYDTQTKSQSRWVSSFWLKNTRKWANTPISGNSDL